MDKKTLRDIILQKVDDIEFEFYVVSEPDDVDTSYDFNLTLSKDEVLSRVLDQFADTDMFEGVSVAPSNLQERVDERVAELEQAHPDMWFGVMWSGLDNYADAWREIYNHMDGWDAETIEHALQYFDNPSNFRCDLFWWVDGYDVESEFLDDDFMAPCIEGEGVVRDISYYICDRLIELSCHVWEELLYVRISDFNIAGGDARKVEVKDVDKLMSILGVDRIEDVIDALMEKCKTIDSPLDKDLFYHFLKENGLEYDEQVIGEYIAEYDDEDNLICTYHPIETGN